jgi:hypothetical protein
MRDRMAWVFLLRQVGAADAHIRHLDAEALRLVVHPLADLAHDPGAVGREHRQQRLVPRVFRSARRRSGPSRSRMPVSVAPTVW